jgi:hypothetical protein
MAPFYTFVCTKLQVVSLDAALLGTMEASNHAELARLDAAIAEATEKAGESEVREAHLAKSLYLLKIGDRVRSNACRARPLVLMMLDWVAQDGAESALRVTFEKSVSLGHRLDIAFYCASRRCPPYACLL